MICICENIVKNTYKTTYVIVFDERMQRLGM